MNRIRISVVWLILGVPGSGVSGQDGIPVDTTPTLRISAGGPVARISSLAFSPNGDQLFAGSHDRLIHVWNRTDNRFQYDGSAVFRIPIGGRLDGAINAIAVSPDGEWLAAGGLGVKRGVATAKAAGWFQPNPGAVPPAARMDEGTIYVFNIRTRQCRQLRGHHGAVVSLNFAPEHPDKPPILVSAAQDIDTRAGEVVAWNVATGTAIRELTKIPQRRQQQWEWQPLPAPNELSFPKTAVIHSGPALDDLQIAIAWGDGAPSNKETFHFRIWNVRTRQVTGRLTADTNLYFGLAAARQVIRTVRINNRFDGGEFGEWRINPAEFGAPTNYRILQSHSLSSSGLPLALATAGDSSVVITVDRSQYRIRLSDSPRSLALWQYSGAPTQPALATSGDGQWVAVAGNRDHAIHVLPIQSLRTGSNDQQVIRLDRARYTGVAFATRGTSRGILLKNNDSGIVLNFSDGTMSSKVSDWNTEVRPANGWQITQQQPAVPGKATLLVTRNGQPGTTIELRGEASDSQTVTFHDLAISPPLVDEQPADDSPVAQRQGYQRPLVAVAWSCGNEPPRLDVFDLRNGELLRRYMGHEDTVRSVAFSKDGRLLVSYADDHTVNVWHVADIEGLRAHYGMVRMGNSFLKTTKQNGRIIVVDAFGTLPAGASIQSLTGGNKELDVSSQEAMFQQVADACRPGTDLVIGTDQGNVTVQVGEAIDERRPLFSLYIDENSKRWVGWHPSGLFDSSGLAAESLIGWHFNTGKMETPVRYAAIEQYREGKRTPGLLRHLLDRERVPERTASLKKPRATVLALDDRGQPINTDYQEAVVSLPPLGSTFSLLDDFPVEMIDAVDWRIRTLNDASEFAPAELVGRRQWRVSFPKRVWERGLHDVEFRLKTSEFKAQAFLFQEQFRYHPPAPQVRIEEFAETQSEKSFRLKLSVVSSSGQQMTLSVRQSDADGKRVSEKTSTGDQTVEFAETFTLANGLNRFDILAGNNGAEPEFEDLEQTRLARVVEYKEKLKPSVLLTQYTSGGKTIELESGESLVRVRERTLVLRGLVRNSESSVRISKADTVLQTIQPTRGVFESKPIDLLEGEQTLSVSIDGAADRRISVRFEATPLSFAQLRLETIPLAGVTLPDDLPAAQAIAGLHKKQALIAASLDGAIGNSEIIVAINDQPLDIKPTQAGEQFTFEIPLSDGENRIRLTASDELGRKIQSQALQIPFLQPPRNVRIRGEQKISTLPMKTLIVAAESTLPIDRQGVRIRVDDAPAIVGKVDPKKTGSDDGWVIEISDIELPDRGVSKHRITVQVANADGVNIFPAKPFDVEFEKQPVAPVLEFLSPGEAVIDRNVSVSVKCVSESPLVEVRLEVNGKEMKALTDAARLSGPRFTFANVALAESQTDLRVIARNQDGAVATVQRQVQYTAPPARLVNVTVDGQSAATQGGKLQFPKVDKPVVVVSGEIRTSKPLKSLRYARARVQVNGFFYISALKVSGSQILFQSEVALNQTSNQLEIDVVGIVLESVQGRAYTVACTKPLRDQELHLLLVDVDPAVKGKSRGEATAELQKRAFQALNARIGNDNIVRTPSFENVQVYGPLTGGDANADRIRVELSRIETDIPAGNPLDVILIYFRGRQKKWNDEYVLLTNEYLGDRKIGRNAINVDELAEFLASVGGAHVVLMDVGPEFSDDLSTIRHQPLLEDNRLGVVIHTNRAVSGNVAQTQLMSMIQQVLPRSVILSELQNGLKSRFGDQLGISVPLPLAGLRIGGRETD